MELLEGTDLRRLLGERGPLPVADACELVRQAALGLQHAHEHGIVHRDVKPDNLFLTAAGVVKVIDLGLARVQNRQAGSNLSTGRVIMGTPEYLAPEQWDSAAVDHRADIYALGCVLYALLTGRSPYQDEAEGPVGADVSPPNQAAARSGRACPAAPPALAQLVARMLAKAPDQRPADGRAVAEALAAVHAGPRPAGLAGAGAERRQETATARLATEAVPARARPSRRPLLAGAALVAVVLGGVAFWWWLPPRGTVPERTARPEASTPLPDTYTNGLGMEFVLVPKGKSWLGGGDGKPGDKEVEIPADFYLGKYEVTQEEWQKVMGSNPSSFSRTGAEQDAVKDIPDEDLKRFPVEMVSWDDAQLFLEELNRAEKEPGWVYRLPTETEWEYACRGGPMADRAAGALRLLPRPSRRTSCCRDRRISGTRRGCSGPARWARTSRTGWGCTTCTATSTSGAPTPGESQEHVVGRLLRGGTCGSPSISRIGDVVMPAAPSATSACAWPASRASRPTPGAMTSTPGGTKSRPSPPTSRWPRWTPCCGCGTRPSMTR